MPQLTVSRIIKRWRLAGHQLDEDRRKYRAGRRKINEEQERLIVSLPVLSAYKSYSLRERVQRLQLDHGIHISHCVLYQYYKRHGVKYRATDLASINKLAKAASIHREQFELVEWVDQIE